VVASGGGDDAALFLFARQLRESVARAAFLEAAGPLLIIELAVNFEPGELAQGNRFSTGRLIDGALDAAAGCFDIGEGNQRRECLTAPPLQRRRAGEKRSVA
jgi:hypothetical protein